MARRAVRRSAFLRPRDLRIGATLRGRNGQMLQFFRRRGDKNTLLDASGAALSDDALAPFLGAATREIFHRAFGLDAKALREGGDEMLRADGEIGASLLAAASGLRGLIDLRAGLNDEAEKIFGDRKASHRSFYQALARYDAAREQERAATLSDSTLKNLKAEIVAAQRQIADIEGARKLAQAERLRLDRLAKAAPILKNLARQREELAACADLAALPPDWPQAFGKLAEARKNLADALAGAARGKEAARLEMEEAEFDAALLAEAEEIEAVIRASGAYEKLAADLPRREEAERQARRLLALRAQECGLPDAGSLRAAAPDADTLRKAEKLVEKGRDILARQLEPRRVLAEEEAFFARMQAEQPEPSPDAGFLREKFLALGPVASWDVNWREASLAVAEGARELAEKCARLAPPLADLDHFAKAPSPELATIELAARTFDALDARAQSAREKAQAARKALQAAQAQLAALERQGAIASPDQMREAREARDAEWAFLRATLLGQRAEPAPVERSAHFEALVARADASADALLADSARVAAALAEREKIAVAKRELDEAEKSLADVERERTKNEAEWQAAWAASAVKPLAPRLMAPWRSRADSLLEARDALARGRARAGEWKRNLAGALPHLEALAGECGLPPMENLDSAALARRIEARLTELARAEDAAREARAKLADAPVRIARLKLRLGQLAEEEAQWREEWRAALASLRLDFDAQFDEAQKRIKLWRALPIEADDESEKAERVRKITGDMEEFEQKLDALLARSGRDLTSRPVESAVGQLRDRLSRAREKAALRAKAKERLGLAEAAAQKAEGELAAIEAALREMGAAAENVGLGGDAETLLRRFEARENLGLAIRAERERLFLVADGLEERILAEEAENFDQDAARIRIDEIDRQSQAEELSARDIHAGLRAREGELARLQADAGAEGAIQAKENARAEIFEESRRWAVLKLAALLVNAGMERSRDRRKDPLLARAGALFSTLTGARYAGLVQAFGEDDSLHLRRGAATARNSSFPR